MSAEAGVLNICNFEETFPPGATLIEASAGTGKTYTVAALFLRLILENGLGVGEILVTTFTIPATAELRERIRGQLMEARAAFETGATKDEFLAAMVARFRGEATEMRERLTQALQGFDEAAIYTIHGFCQRMLQDSAFESGLLFDQEFVTDETRLFREVSEDYWRRKFYDCEVCARAAASAEKLSPESLAKLLRERLTQPLAEIIPAIPEKELPAIEEALTARLSRLRKCWEKGAAEVEAHFGEANGWAISDYAKREKMRGHLDAVKRCMAEGSKLTGFVSLLKMARSEIETGTGVRNEPPQHEFYEECEELSGETARYAIAVKQDFLRWAPAELERRKLRLNVHSYSDLLTRLHAALTGPYGEKLAAAIRERFRAALIDEFQDTDPLQEEIFRRIFGDGKSWLFLIGDPKQAIFGFRGADVFSYLGAARRAERRFTLQTNYRSSEALVAATNHIFSRSTRAFVIDGITFREAQASGKPDAEAFLGRGVNAPMRIWQWPMVEKESVDKSTEKVAQAVAAEIARILQGAGSLGGRAIVPADIAVLTRTKWQAQEMRAALREFGVPGVMQSNASIFESQEAAELLAVLTAVARPRDERSLRAALLTSLFGGTARQIHALADDESTWEKWLLRFARWHELWNSEGFIQMFRRAILEAGVRARLLARLDGERSLTNLLHLSEILQQISTETRRGPEGVVTWLAEQIAQPPSDGREEYELRLERDDAAVRIVTVHKSKGLQYNIVFCPFLWSSRKEKGGMRFHDPEHDGKLTLDLASPAPEEHQVLADAEQLADAVRLMYVALTRACQRCDIIWGSLKGYERSAAGWLFHPPPEISGSVSAAAAAHLKETSESAMQADLEALAASSSGGIEVVPVPDAEAPRYFPPENAGGRSTPREFTGKIERDWTVSSFSSLMEHHDAEAPDYDTQVTEPPEAEEMEARGIHAFPAGTRAGICLHAIFQEVDFTNPADLAALVRAKLLEYSFDADAWEEAVVDCVTRTLQTPLKGGFALRDVESRRRRAELEFYLPARRLEAGMLRELLFSDDRQRLEFAPRRGWLKGYIDLVFEHGGRYFIADWKSNRLGSHRGAYERPALHAAMVAHHYKLQYVLYTVALHRYLKWRLPGYDYERHFGGVFYFFLRGIDPAQRGHGIVHERTPVETIMELDRRLT